MSERVPRLLLVEDERDERVALARALRERFIVEEAGSLEEAKEKLAKASPPDLIITDVRLQPSADNRDGLLLLQEVQRGGWDIPAIVVTAYGASQWIHGRNGKVDAKALGAAEVLTKPFTIEQLESAIDVNLRPTRGAAFRRTIAEWFPVVAVFVGSLVLWEGAVRLFSLPEYLLPAPSIIGAEIVEKFTGLLSDTGITLFESLLGFAISNVLSIVIAVGFVHSRWLERSVYPYMIALKSVPVIALAPLLVLWLGYGIWGKVAMAAIISFFPLVVNATLGLKAVDPAAVDLMRSLSATRRQILLKLRFPTALPYIFSALKISSTLAVVGAIVGEMTGAKEGIGFVILMASYNIDTPLLFAAIIAASLAGLLFFLVVAGLEGVVLRRFGFSHVQQGNLQ